MGRLDIELPWRRGDARKLRLPERPHFLDVPLRIEQRHVRYLRHVDTESVEGDDLVVALGIRQVLFEQLGKIPGTAAASRHRKDEVFHADAGRSVSRLGA